MQGGERPRIEWVKKKAWVNMIKIQMQISQIITKIEISDLSNTGHGKKLKVFLSERELQT